MPGVLQARTGLIISSPAAPVGVILPVDYITGLGISPGTIPDEEVDIAIGRCLDDLNSFSIIVGAPLTADNTISGVNGLDVGVVAALTLYSVWVIADSTGVNAVASLLSLSATAPTLPAGYDKKRRVGWGLTDSTSDFINYLQTGNGRKRRIWYDVVVGIALGTRVLTNGSAAVFTDVDVSSFVPSTSLTGLLAARFSTGGGGLATDNLILRPDGFSVSASNGPIIVAVGIISGLKLGMPVEIPWPGQIFEYMVTDATNNLATISITAYDDQL